MEPLVRLLYIAGNGRSGSTILNVVLGQLPGFFTVGEVTRVWERGVMENQPCGCGARFRDCAIWQAVFARAFGGFDGVDAARMATLRDRHCLTKRIPGLMWRRDHGPSSSPDLEEYLAATRSLYRAIGYVSGSEVIVDASKWPAYGYLLDRSPGFDLSVVHLVRDPRAAAFSWRRVKESGAGRHLLRQHPLRSTAYWMVWNTAIPYFWRRPGKKYALLTYESFVVDPQHRIEEILRFAGVGRRPLPFVDANTVLLRPTHGVGGNVERLKTGRVPLRIDDEWERRLAWHDRALVTSLTWPWLVKYGYWG